MPAKGKAVASFQSALFSIRFPRQLRSEFSRKISHNQSLPKSWALRVFTAPVKRNQIIQPCRQAFHQGSRRISSIMAWTTYLCSNNSRRYVAANRICHNTLMLIRAILLAPALGCNHRRWNNQFSQAKSSNANRALQTVVRIHKN